MEYEALTLAYIGKLAETERTEAFTVVAGMAAGMLVRCINSLDSITISTLDAIDFGEECYMYFYEIVEEREEKKLAEKSEKFQAKTENRATYLPGATLSIMATKREGMPYWRYEFDLESTGLMPCVIAHEQKVDGPVALQIVNRLPYEIDDKGQSIGRFDINDEEYDHLANDGWQVSKDKVAWKWGYVAEKFVRMYPQATEFSSYNHRFRSPLLPGGFFAGQRVAFHQLCWEDEDGNFINQGCDGSGCYDPSHPMFAEFIAKYGIVPVQITIMCKTSGMMAKGILMPREGICELLGVDTPWFPDHLQVKGSQKEFHKQAYVDDEITVYEDCYIGIMKVWNRRATMGAGFEQLENIGPLRRKGESTMGYLRRKQEVLRIMNELTDEGMAKLLRGGVDRLLAKVARDDKNLKLIIDFCAKAQELGSNISPLTTTMVKHAVDEALQKALWVPAQGAGIRGTQLVVVNDSSVPEGMVVCAGEPIGVKTAIWRFPTVLACGLVVCKTIHSRPHQQVNGRTIPFCVFLNPRDVLKMQGDDDGDIIALSSDPRVVKLWESRLDDRFYAIEPEGQKLGYATDSAEGWDYIRHDPMGPVGACTVGGRTRLLAAKDYDGALAMSVAIQESIDVAKRKVRVTNWEKSSDPSNWRLCEDGSYHIHWFRIGDQYYGNSRRKEFTSVDEESQNFYDSADEGFPLDEMMEWCNKRLTTRGCINTKKQRQNPLGWRSQTKRQTPDGNDDPTVELVTVKVKKRIVPSTWAPSASKQSGWEGGNWVHHVHDRCLDIWRAQESEFMGDVESFDLNNLLATLLEQVGVDTEVPELTWEEYLLVREKAGITAYGKRMRQIMLTVQDYDLRMRELNLVQSGLEASLCSLSMNDLATIWYYETTPRWGYKTYENKTSVFTLDRNSVPEKILGGVNLVNKPNHAFRAVTSPGNAMLAALEIETEEECDFLDQPAVTASTRLGGLLRAIERREDKFGSLTDTVYGKVWNALHAKHTTDENGDGIKLHECLACKRKLQDGFVRRLRANHEINEQQVLKDLVSHMRGQPRNWKVPVDADILAHDNEDDWNPELYA
jgi:hypothetical protein